jgi:tRNA(Ile2)-agmatinylcytidine synthase
MILSEQTLGFLLFETNQGTDDHLQKRTIQDIQPYQSVLVRGSVVSPPRTIPGGHVLFSIGDATGTIDCAAYEPTKQFRNVIRELTIGDRIDVYGGVREHPVTVNLEKINIRSLAKLHEKTENPICLQCGKHMKSRGTNQGYKCKRCGKTKKKPKTKLRKRSINTGFYEVPVCARRHLSKPLKRMQ